MTPTRNARRLAPALLVRVALLALAAPGGRAAAQNADGILLGPEASMAAGAVLATARDAAGAYYNPAGLAALEGSSVQISGSVYEASSTRLSSFISTALPWTRVEETVTAVSAYSVPAVVAVGLRLRPGLGVAAGVWVPVHREASFVSSLRSAGPYAPGGSVTSAEYEQHLSVSQTADRTYFGAAAGLALSPRLRAGLAAFASYDSAEEFVSVFSAARTDSPVPGESGATASVALSGAPFQVAARVAGGLQWDVSPSLAVALSARSPSVALARGGTVSAVASGTALLPGAPPAVFFLYERGEALRLSEPWRLAAGGALALGPWSLRAEADWQAPRDGLSGVANARVGLLHDAGANVRFGAGLFTDRSRASDRAASTDVDYLGATAGASYRPPPVAAARARGEAFDLWTSLAVRYAYGRGDAQGLALDPFGTGAAPPGSGPVEAHVLSLSIGGHVQY